MQYVVVGTAKGKSFKIPTSHHDKIYDFFDHIYGKLIRESSGMPISIEVADWAELADVGEHFDDTSIALNCHIMAIPEWYNT